MKGDTEYEGIITVLSEIHSMKPNLRFGMILQSALDQKKSGHNIDFHNLSSKEIRIALENFRERLSGVKR